MPRTFQDGLFGILQYIRETFRLSSGYSSNNTRGSLSISRASIQYKVNAISNPATYHLLYAIIAVVIIIASIGAVLAKGRAKK